MHSIASSKSFNAHFTICTRKFILQAGYIVIITCIQNGDEMVVVKNVSLSAVKRKIHALQLVINQWQYPPSKKLLLQWVINQNLPRKDIGL